jgi:hypothetical protein
VSIEAIAKRVSAAILRQLPGPGCACGRCGNTSYQIYDGIRECDNCGLEEGAEPFND